MHWLNYNHLMYFWMTAREGSMSAAARQLHVTQPTVSGQVRELEDACGGKLLSRKGNRLELTALGHRVFGYADDIFGLGQELMASVHRPDREQPARLVVGVVDAMPKLVAHELLRPALGLPNPIYLEVRAGPLDRLLGNLSVHTVDLVLSDAPISPHFHVRAFNHPLGESPVEIFAAEPLASALRDGFPESLTDQPFLLPSRGTMLRRSLEHWFQANDIAPRFVAELDDSALLKAFAHDGLGAFAAPYFVDHDLAERYEVVSVGRASSLTERYYAISVERKIRHPAVAAITESASKVLTTRRKA